MNYNYHTHTYRCGHASGSEEEYIQRAIRCGIKYIGFSDHIPFVCDDGYESPHRVPMKAAKEYVATISALREKYADKIDIKIGFEAEYYPEDFEKMLKTATEVGAEYLIVGQHWLANEHLGGQHTMVETSNPEDLKRYINLVISAIKSGVVTYIAHPDMFVFEGDAETYKQEMRKICVASREYNIPLEINFLGIREKRSYPNEIFWEIAGEEQPPVVFGFDAHTTQSAYDGESLLKAEEMVKKYKLNYIGKPNLIFLNNV